MSIKYYPIKSVLIKGILNSPNESDKLIYKLCPVTEFSEGLWNLSIVSLFYNCRITTNVKDFILSVVILLKLKNFQVKMKLKAMNNLLQHFI